MNATSENFKVNKYCSFYLFLESENLNRLNEIMDHGVYKMLKIYVSNSNKIKYMFA